MSFFGPKHTAESVAAELIKGLEDGTITLDEPEPESSEPHAAPVGSVQSEGSGSLLLVVSIALAAVATALASTVLLLASGDPLPWAFLVACFVACGACAAVAFWLGTTAATSFHIRSAPKLPTDSDSRPA